MDALNCTGGASLAGRGAHIAIWLAIAASLVLPLPASAWDRLAEPASEDDVKAAFVVNFLRFASWPASAAQGPFQICAATDGPLYQSLTRLASVKTVIGRPVQVSTVTADDLQRCHILLLESLTSRRLSSWIRTAEGHALLTVSDIPHFLESGGMFQLVLDNQRIAFDIRLDSIRRSGLQVSSSLLRLARNLKDYR